MRSAVFAVSAAIVLMGGCGSRSVARTSDAGDGRAAAGTGAGGAGGAAGTGAGGDAAAAAGGSATGGSGGSAGSNDAARDAPLDAGVDAIVERDAIVAGDAIVERNEAGAAFVAAIGPYCEDKARVWCAFLSRCNRAYATDDDCRVAEKARCLAPVDVWEAQAASQGRLAFDETRVAGCLTTIEGQNCDAATLEPATCDEVRAGRMADGQACLHARECRGGICHAPDAVCPGTCGSLSKVGGPCGDDWRYGCDLGGAWCDTVARICRPKLARGASCHFNGGDPETTCAPDDYCESTRVDLPCNFDFEVIGCLCARRRGPGAVCEMDQQCQGGLVCDAGRCLGPTAAKGAACGFLAGCAGDLVCLAKTPPTDPTRGACGDRLPDGAGCVREDCRRGSHCAGVCKHDARLGEPCDPSGPCPNGTFCDGAQVCSTRPTLGESCSGSLQGHCWGGNLTCAQVGSDVLCVPIPAVGQGCSFACSDGAYCANKVCAPRKGQGAACASSVECASGFCEIPRGCQTATCAVKVCTEVCSYASLGDGGA